MRRGLARLSAEQGGRAGQGRGWVGEEGVGDKGLGVEVGGWVEARMV